MSIHFDVRRKLQKWNKSLVADVAFGIVVHEMFIDFKHLIAQFNQNFFNFFIYNFIEIDIFGQFFIVQK